jgi:hypothetical protein
MTERPQIAVILDENTSGDGSRYEASKSYFRAIVKAGGLPFGAPYFPELVQPVLDEFDAVLSCGGRFAYPNDRVPRRKAVEGAIQRALRGGTGNRCGMSGTGEADPRDLRWHADDRLPQRITPDAGPARRFPRCPEP